MHSSVPSIEMDPDRTLCRIDGVDYPMVGFGTYRLRDEACTEAVMQAAKWGYRIIDTATYYENFDGLGKALKRLDRRHFYIISKVWHDQHSSKNLRQDLERTLKQLQIDCLDAYLLHWPNSKISIEETLETMEELRQQEKIRHIGLSNVSVNHLQRALEVGVPIAWVQVEMHPYFYDRKLLEFCREHSIAIQAWRPLNFGRIDKDKFLTAMGKKYDKTPCQVALRWIVQHGCIPLPKSKSEDHIRENLEIGDFTLSEEEMNQISAQSAIGARLRLTEKDKLGFLDEFDFSYQECWPKSNTLG